EEAAGVVSAEGQFGRSRSASAEDILVGRPLCPVPEHGQIQTPSDAEDEGVNVEHVIECAGPMHDGELDGVVPVLSAFTRTESLSNQASDTDPQVDSETQFDVDLQADLQLSEGRESDKLHEARQDARDALLRAYKKACISGATWAAECTRPLGPSQEEQSFSAPSLGQSLEQRNESKTEAG
ncbi:unnamed protein product, partial [Amoebophrya sp. A25]